MRPPASTNSLSGYTAGSRFFAARATRCLRSLMKSDLGRLLRFRRERHESKAGSKNDEFDPPHGHLRWGMAAGSLADEAVRGRWLRGLAVVLTGRAREGRAIRTLTVSHSP